jgi:hypothetical protein
MRARGNTWRLRGRLKGRRATWSRWVQLLTAKPIAIPVITLTVLALAFISYGAMTRLRPTKFSRGGPVYQVGSTPTALPSTGSDDAASSGSGAIRAPKPPRASKKPGAKGGTAAGGGTPSTGGSPSLAEPATGVYQIRMSGHESVHFGPVSICNRDLPSSAQLSVSKAEGETPTSYVFDLPISGDHTERHIYRFEGDELFLDFEGARVTCAGISETSEVSFSPPELRARAPLSVGGSWSGRSGDEDRTESYRTTVVRTESITVAGLTVPTFVIETSIDLTGNENGRRFQRWWYAPTLGLPVRWYEEISAERRGATYSEQATFTVVSLP